MSINNNIRSCDGCKFCCWSFGITELNKEALNHCEYECKKGCSIHGREDYPPSCKWFTCPYLIGENIKRPDTYQSMLKKLSGNIGNYIPAIPINFDSDEVGEMVTTTRSLPAYIMIKNEWHEVIMPLDRKEDNSWMSTKEIIEQWESIYNKYSEVVPKEMMNVIMI